MATTPFFTSLLRDLFFSPSRDELINVAGSSLPFLDLL